MATNFHDTKELRQRQVFFIPAQSPKWNLPSDSGHIRVACTNYKSFIFLCHVRRVVPIPGCTRAATEIWWVPACLLLCLQMTKVEWAETYNRRYHVLFDLVACVRSIIGSQSGKALGSRPSSNVAKASGTGDRSLLLDARAVYAGETIGRLF